MGRTFNPHAGRLRSTEFDSRGALISSITLSFAARMSRSCRRRGVGVSASLSARRSRVRVPPVALFIAIEISALTGRFAAVGELESSPRCQRGDRGFESRRWRRSISASMAILCRRRGAGIPASLSARRSRVRTPPVALEQGRAWCATRGFEPRKESSNLSAPYPSDLFSTLMNLPPT